VQLQFSRRTLTSSATALLFELWLLFRCGPRFVDKFAWATPMSQLVICGNSHHACVLIMLSSTTPRWLIPSCVVEWYN
jgi:hypothetical protein